MPGRKTTGVLLAAGAAVLVAATSLVTAGAVSSPSDGVRACRTDSGYLTLPSAAGHCAKGEQGVTIGRRGATGARGPAGAPGSTKALFDSGSAVLAQGAPGSPHGPQPTATTAATVSDVPAGTYLVSLSLTVRNNSTNRAEIDCTTTWDNRGAKGTAAGWGETVSGTDGTVSDTAGGATIVSGSGSGWVTSPGGVSVSCLNYGATGADASVTAAITLTPVASVRSTTG